MANIITLDDVRDAAVIIGKILRKKGHSVHTFTEEEDAITHAELHKVDLAILDINLKKMHGLDVLSVLKQINPATKVLILTGYPDVTSSREAMKRGADEYCVKPIDREVLEEKVEDVLKRPRAAVQSQNRKGGANRKNGKA